MSIQMEELKECRSPNCTDPPKEGRRFCEPHCEIFDSIKASERARSDKIRSTIRRPNAQPTCCAPGCREPRLSAERYCPACTAQGWLEEDYGE